MDHCAELQSFVEDLKQSMEKAMDTLAGIHEDDNTVKNRVEEMEKKCRKDIAEIMATIDGIKKELGTVNENVQQLQNQQCQVEKRMSDLVQNQQRLDVSNRTRLSSRRSRSADVMAADHDSGIHSTNGAILTDHSSSPHSGRTSPRSVDGSPSGRDDDVVYQNRLLTSNLKRQLFPSYSTPLLCVDYASDKEREDSDLEPSRLSNENQQQQIRVERSSTVIRRQSRKPSQHLDSSKRNRQHRQCCSLGRNDALERNRDERYKIFTEMVNSERAYCNRLWHMQSNMYEPLKEENLIPQKDLNILFPHELKLVYEQHCVLLHKLQRRLSHWEEEKEFSLATLFCPQFDSRSYLACIYADYAGAFSKITETFKENFLKNPERMEILKCRSGIGEQKKDVESDMSVDEFLVMPLERVSYYMRILKKLAGVSQSETERHALSSLVENLQEVAVEINNCIKRALTVSGTESSADREEQSDSSNGRALKKRYSKRASQALDACCILGRTDSAARRARSAAALIKKQMQQQQHMTTLDNGARGLAVSGSNYDLLEPKQLSCMDWAMTFPRRQEKVPNVVKETQERFLTFGRCDTSIDKNSPSTVFSSAGFTGASLVRSFTSDSVSTLEKCKQENSQSEPDLSQATSSSTNSSGSPLRSVETTMPITIKEPSPPMPVLKQRSRPYVRGNVVPIRYTRTSDFDIWRANEMSEERDENNLRSMSLSPTRSVSMKLPPTEMSSNDTSTIRKMKHSKSGSSTKTVHSLRNSLAAFFSKRKNEHRFNANANHPSGTNRATSKGLNSYSFWPAAAYPDGSDMPSSQASSVALASNPNVRLLAGAIPRPRRVPSPTTRPTSEHAYGFDYGRRESFDPGRSDQQTGQSAFVTTSPLYWWHKEKTSFKQHPSNADFVEV